MGNAAARKAPPPPVVQTTAEAASSLVRFLARSEEARLVRITTVTRDGGGLLVAEVVLTLGGAVVCVRGPPCTEADAAVRAALAYAWRGVDRDTEITGKPRRRPDRSRPTTAVATRTKARPALPLPTVVIRLTIAAPPRQPPDRLAIAMPPNPTLTATVDDTELSVATPPGARYRPVFVCERPFVMLVVKSGAVGFAFAS